MFSAFADYLRPDNTLTWRVWKRAREDAEGGGSSEGSDTEAVVVAAGDGGDGDGGGEAAGGGTPSLSQERWCVMARGNAPCMRSQYLVVVVVLYAGVVDFPRGEGGGGGALRACPAVVGGFVVFGQLSSLVNLLSLAPAAYCYRWLLSLGKYGVV